MRSTNQLDSHSVTPEVNALQALSLASSDLAIACARAAAAGMITDMAYDYEALYRTLTRRYGSVEPDAMVKVLCPLHVPLSSLDKTIVRLTGQHYRASFTVDITSENAEMMVAGRTGKFIPYAHLSGEPWREIAKGRIIEIDPQTSIAKGEVYVGSSSQSALKEALEELTEQDVLEIDQYGAAAKVLSALVEATLATQLKANGFLVRRMPEDTARYLGSYPNYDFQVVRDGVIKTLEVKSLWGTNTRYARLIHGKGRDYPTSSCKFATQDFFAVSLFLLTGNIADFAFARSVPEDVHSYGLPRTAKYPDHVNQNPLLVVGNGVWFASLEDVWNLP